MLGTHVPNCPQRHLMQAQKSRPDAQPCDRAQQPAQVVARRTANRVQRIAQHALEPATIQPVIRLQMPDRRLHRLAPLQPASLLLTQALVTAPVNDLHTRVVIRPRLCKTSTAVFTPNSKGLWRAISSSRLSTGCAMALSCTVVSTITRSNSSGFDGPDAHGRVDRGLEHLLQALLAHRCAAAITYGAVLQGLG